MSVDTSVIGAKTGAWRVTVERAPVANFARVLQDPNPVLDGTPAPPTFSFVMAYWGAYPDDQPPDPTGGTNPMHRIMGELHAKGALVLHGEQEFVYHRTPVAGDVLDGVQTITDIYERGETKRRDDDLCVVMELRWRGAKNGEPVVTRPLQPHRPIA